MNGAGRVARLQSLADGVLRVGPRVIHLDVTNACNARCLTCWDHSPRVSRPASWKKQQQNIESLSHILDEALALGGLEAVILSGMGEPFVHPEIASLVSAVKQRGLHLTIITNLVAADPGLILQQQVDQLLVGIHAASLPTYLAFHPGFDEPHWVRLHAALAQFRAAGRRFKHVQVICATNAHELVAMVSLGAQYQAAQVNFKLASLDDRRADLRLSDQQRDWLLGEGIAEAEAEARRQGTRTNLEVFRQQVTTGGGATAPMAQVGCFLGYDYCRITADGTALYCCNNQAKVGRVGAPGDFSRLWQGPAWEALRLRLARGRFLPGCDQCGKLDENLRLASRYRERFGTQPRAGVAESVESAG
jgi:MoaA/NifB/PqqE/SkfB family radical SAM enzyme